MKNLASVALILVLILSCKKEETIPLPVRATLTTAAVFELTSTSVTSGGNITSDGESEIIERGVCYSISTMPTIEHNKVASGNGMGTFTTKISGLKAGTTYYIRAYAMNCAGTAYGNELNFFTPYQEVTIGTQTWMLKDLDVSTYRNGDPIPQVTDPVAWAALTTGAWCWYKNDSATFGSVYGRLYNWYAVNDPRGLAPKGWHVPSDAEYTTLSNFLRGAPIAGNALKESGTSHWLGPNTDATNSSGFTSLPGGNRSQDGKFYYVFEQNCLWSSTADNQEEAWFYFTISNNSYFPRVNSYKKFGLSVRCVKD